VVAPAIDGAKRRKGSKVHIAVDTPGHLLASMLAPRARLSVIVHPTLLRGGATDSNATFQLGALPAGATANAQSAADVGGELQLRTAASVWLLVVLPMDSLSKM
jgi:hypothetical protein